MEWIRSTSQGQLLLTKGSLRCQKGKSTHYYHHGDHDNGQKQGKRGNIYFGSQIQGVSAYHGGESITEQLGSWWQECDCSCSHHGNERETWQATEPGHKL